MGEAAGAGEEGGVPAAVDWLVEGARTVRSPQDVLAKVCRRLVDCGLPLHRVAVFVRTLHPNVMGRRFLWRRDEGVVVSEAPYAMLESDTYRASPTAAVFASAQAVRRRIAAPDCPDDYPIVAELRADGVTDYLMQPLPFTNGEVHAVSWTTRGSGASRTPRSRRFRRSVCRSRTWPRSSPCGGSRPRCSAPTSAAAPASASCRVISRVATSSASTP